MDLNAATSAAATRGKDLRDGVKKNAGPVGTALGLAVLVIGLLIVWWTWPSKQHTTTATSTTSATHAAVTTPQVVYVRDGLVIPVGLTWGTSVFISGDPCVFWDGPAGLQWETSQDGGRTWGQFPQSNAVHFKSPINGTVKFFVQPPPPPGETCKRRY